MTNRTFGISVGYQCSLGAPP